MRFLPVLAAASAFAVLATGASAQSAKFDATWSTDPVMAEAYVDSDTASSCISGSGTGTLGDPCIAAEAVIASLHVAQQKDLLIGVSAEIGLVTFTQAKGRNADPTLGSALASADIKATITIEDESGVVQVAAPGQVTFASRLQELKVDLGASDDEYYTEVIVSLLLDTTAAHHFNFVGVDLPQGVYDVVANFDLSAYVAIVGEDAIANAKVVLGPRMVTVQEVRAAKDAFVSAD